VEQGWYTATAWIGLAFLASLISIRIGISVALVEIFLGFVAGNAGAYLGFHQSSKPTAWNSISCRFWIGGPDLSGRAELNRRLCAASSTHLGHWFCLLSVPILGAWAFAYYVSGWNLQAAQVAGIALSTTSMAVVYAVMVETGLNETDLGKLILSACFVTDLGTVLGTGTDFRQLRLLAADFFVVVTGAGHVAAACHVPLGVCQMGGPHQ